MTKHRLSSRAALWAASLLTMLLPRTERQRWRRTALATLQETVSNREPSLRRVLLEVLEPGLRGLLRVGARHLRDSPCDRSPRPKGSDLVLRRHLGAFRRLARRRPGYSVAALGLLSLGLGSATAIFSVLDPVLLRPLAFDPDARLFTVLA